MVLLWYPFVPQIMHRGALVVFSPPVSFGNRRMTYTVRCKLQTKQTKIVQEYAGHIQIINGAILYTIE
jgi:hypothetical protein